jgi:hypothetical protein
MSEFDQLYRELILDHYKNPRNHGLLEPADAHAEGQNPLCGDEVTVTVRLGAGDVIEDVGFDGRGCAISQAATSMLSDLVKGKTASEVAAMPKEEPLTSWDPALHLSASVRDPVSQNGRPQGAWHASPGRVGDVEPRPGSRVGGGRGSPARRAQAGRCGSSRREV